MIAVKMNVPFSRASVKQLPHWLEGDDPHTHNALDDARKQARAFSNVIEWRGVSFYDNLPSSSFTEFSGEAAHVRF